MEYIDGGFKEGLGKADRAYGMFSMGCVRPVDSGQIIYSETGCLHLQPSFSFTLKILTSATVIQHKFIMLFLFWLHIDSHLFLE